MKKHLSNLSLFAVLLILLALPIGSFGMGKIDGGSVLSVMDTRTVDQEEFETDETTLPLLR